jgi:hypothetical protein
MWWEENESSDVKAVVVGVITTRLWLSHVCSVMVFSMIHWHLLFILNAIGRSICGTLCGYACVGERRLFAEGAMRRARCLDPSLIV